jgi:hypothetical protein
MVLSSKKFTLSWMPFIILLVNLKFLLLLCLETYILLPELSTVYPVATNNNGVSATNSSVSLLSQDFNAKMLKMLTDTFSKLWCQVLLIQVWTENFMQSCSFLLKDKLYNILFLKSICLNASHKYHL